MLDDDHIDQDQPSIATIETLPSSDFGEFVKYSVTTSFSFGGSQETYILTHQLSWGAIPLY